MSYFLWHIWASLFLATQGCAGILASTWHFHCLKQHRLNWYRQSIRIFALPLPPLPTHTHTHTRTHANSLKDQPLILSFSPAWAIISLIIQNPSSAQCRPSTRKLGVCVCAYLGVWGCVAGCDRNCFPNCLKKDRDLTFACTLQTAACSVNQAPVYAQASLYTHT